MSDEWKTRFPARGAVIERMLLIIGYIEGRDLSQAQRHLRVWDASLDLTGVPQTVVDETRLLLNTALLWVKRKDAQPAIASVEKALELWRPATGPLSRDDPPA